MKKLEFTTIYSFIHCLVDFSTATLIAGILTPTLIGLHILAISILIYNIFAFALQLPLGIISDKLNKNSLVSALGCIIISLAYLFIYAVKNINGIVSILVCIISGLGNALFHIGGGIDILNISDKKASLSGIFVSTGALGLYIGTKIKVLGFTKFYIIPILMLLSSIALIYLYIKNKHKYHVSNKEFDFKELPKRQELLVLFLFIIICIRGYVGAIVKFDWNTSFVIGLINVVAICLGKAIGGIVGDKLGWKKTITTSLILSSILFIFGYKNIICGIFAIFLFNMTMPITLVTLSNIYNHSKGIAFGLNTFALLIGVLPLLLGYGFTSIINNEIYISVITFISTIILFYTLKNYEKLELDGDKE